MGCSRDGLNAYPGVAEAIQYAQEVTGGQRVAAELVRLACRRFLADLDASDNGGEWEFRPDLAERPMVFAGLLPNIKGPEAGQPLRLMAWQRFIFANLFGFVERGSNIRRFRQATCYVPRGNGKTSLAAPIALYLTFLDGEGGAEGYAAAVSRDQARILWETAREMVRRSPEFRARYGIQIAAHSIFQPKTSSKFVAVSSDAKALDGLNVQAAVCDEIGSHRTSHVYDVLLTAMGKRLHPMLVNISTATGNNSGIGKQLWDYAVRVLRGQQQDDRLFALIYTIDESDDPWDEAVWIKANPSWGQAVQPDAIRAIMRQARNNPAQEAAAKTRHLNVWVGADDALFSLRAWRSCLDDGLTLADFEGEPCHMAVDLASKTDLAAVAIVFPGVDRDGRPTYAAFSRCYLNEAAVMEARNASYPGWSADGHIVVTPGNETDMGAIEADLREMASRFQVRSIAFDPWGATQMRQSLASDGLPVVDFPMRVSTLSEPTKELEAAIASQRLRHDGNPVLEWCIGNVVGHYDARANVYPRKSRPEQKIDAAVALIMAIGRAMNEEAVPDMSSFLSQPMFV
ncbi:terminase large subunit [Roseomonas mucosa]|uniref:terminase large subunit n=1 Tax=Roseomonas mucosa TaxID=207340 RepID=UPI0038505C53